jgi:alcohol dehydrogenase class IV
MLAVLGGDMEEYFGTGLVSKAMAAQNKLLIPHLAIQTAASSGAHLTKYANITNIKTGQKKLIVDDAIIPQRAIFDYAVTVKSPPSLTIDGGLDGISHVTEVLYGAVGKPQYSQILPIAVEVIRLVMTYLPRALEAPSDLLAREALGLATDLGGIAIMLGGTNGAHLNSFSLVEILSHGRACGMLNPYYTVFFSPAIQEPLSSLANLYHNLGYLSEESVHLSGRELGMAIARAMILFEERIGSPTRLVDVPGFTEGLLARILAAAKEPQLRMKLENMPVALAPELVDEYMGSVLLAAQSGNLDLVHNLEAAS